MFHIRAPTQSDPVSYLFRLCTSLDELVGHPSIVDNQIIGKGLSRVDLVLTILIHVCGSSSRSIGAFSSLCCTT